MRSLPALALGLMLVAVFTNIALAQNAAPPRVVTSTPAIGARAVDPNLKQLSVTFDQDMAPSFSWTGGGPDYPEITSAPRWLDRRTCVLPVRLKPGHRYRVGINAPGFQNFRGLSGAPAALTALYFETAAANLAPQPPRQEPAAELKALNVRSLEALRQALEQRYSYYDLRKIDWNRLFAEHRDWLLASRTPLEWASRAAVMLAPARDIHVALECDGVGIGAHYRMAPPNFRLQAVQALVPNLEKRENTAWGRTPDGILYVLIASWANPAETDVRQIEGVLGRSKDAKGIILDVRPNAGGDELLARRIAAWFHDRPTVYSKNLTRDPSLPGGWSKPLERIVTPASIDRHNKGPVAVLIGPHCMSSNESFILMMDTAPRARLFGEKTYGSSANPKPHALPNGVTIYLPSWKDLRPDGTAFEGEGIEPDVVVPWPANGPAAGDPVQEKALEWIRS